MVPSKRFCICLLSVFLAASICVAQEMPPDEEWKPITIGETHGFIVPDKVLEDIGLPVRHVPVDENAATFYLQAIEALGDSSKVLSDQGLNEAFNSVLSRNPPGQFPEDLLKWFETTQDARDLVDKAAKLDRCAFPIISGSPGSFSMYGLLLPYLAPMRQFARLKVLEGRLHESRGEFEQAAQSYLDILKIAAHSGQDSTLIGGLVGIACNSMGTNALLRLIAVHPLNAEALARIQPRAASLLTVQPPRGVWIPFERAGSRQVVQRATESISAARHAMDLGFPSSTSSSRAWRIIFPDRTMMKDIDRFFDQYAELATTPSWRVLEQFQEKDTVNRMQETIHDWNFIAFMLLPALDRAESEYTHMQARGDALQIVIALRLYRAERGIFPDTLTELVNKYFESLPPDPFSGEPFHYRREKNDFILWSVGFDLDDDGGRDVGPNRRDDGDLVWRSTWEVAAQ